MKKQMTLEQLQQAHEVEATHYSLNNNLVYKVLSGEWHHFSFDDQCGWISRGDKERLDLVEIDYSPLNGD